MEITLQRINQIIDYYHNNKLHLELKTDELAVKLGIDPKRDTILFPIGSTQLKYTPKWIIPIYGRGPVKLIRGARNK